MEALAGLSQAGSVGLGVRAESVVSRAAGEVRKSAAFLGGRAGFGCSTSSTAFEDKSHVRFYSDGGCGRRGARAARAAISPSAADRARRSHERIIRKMKKAEKKLAKEAAAEESTSASSESSSSSESESESEAAENMACRNGRLSSAQFREEWERIRRSPVMESIPSLSADFTFQRPPVPGIAARLEVTSDESRAVAESSAVGNSLAVLRLSSGACAGSSLGGIAQMIANSAEPSAAPRVEVCMGGKCRKAGSERVLSEFLANGVDASPCMKCMKNCKFAVNVRVQEENATSARMYSGVEMQDVRALSQKYSSAWSRELPPSFGALALR